MHTVGEYLQKVQKRRFGQACPLDQCHGVGEVVDIVTVYI